jgi:hypothetical protein
MGISPNKYHKKFKQMRIFEKIASEFKMKTITLFSALAFYTSVIYAQADSSKPIYIGNPCHYIAPGSI